jgi:hypothetical protein
LGPYGPGPYGPGPHGPHGPSVLFFPPRPWSKAINVSSTYIYIYIYIYCPIRGYSEGLLAVDKRPMRLRPLSAKPKARQGSEKFASRWGLVSIPSTFVTGLQPNLSHAAKSSHVPSDIDGFFVAFLRWLHFRHTSNAFRVLAARNIGKRNEFGASIFRGEFRAPTFVTRPQRNANWRGKCDFRWGRRAKVNDLKSEVNFCMLFARDQ